MKVYTARQAIFNQQQNVVAYELLFREGPENIFPGTDAHEATSKIIVRTQLNDGLMGITNGKRALINFPEQSLLSGLPKVLPCDLVVIEILETVNPSDLVYNCCASLFHRGYKLALDDFVFKPEWQRFLKFIHLIKVDIQKTPLNSLAPLFTALAERPNIKLLAEKVESHEEFAQAQAMGFSFYQGYFFCKPEMKLNHDVESDYILISKLYREATKDNVNINAVVDIFERDTGLSYKLLRFVNAGTLPKVQDISSIKQAVVYIGNVQLRKLVSLLASAMMSKNKPPELIRMSVHRARFCELVAKAQFPALQEQAFICGLFSLLDAILDQPFDQLLARLPLSDDLVKALTTEQPSILGFMLLTIKHYEQGHWYLTERYSRQLHLSYQQVEEYYQQAMQWSEEYQDLIN